MEMALNQVSIIFCRPQNLIQHDNDNLFILEFSLSSLTVSPILYFNGTLPMLMTCTRGYNERVHLWSYIENDMDANFPNNLKSQKSKGTNNTERASLGGLIESDVCNLSCVGEMICSSSRYVSIKRLFFSQTPCYFHNKKSR